MPKDSQTPKDTMFEYPKQGFAQQYLQTPAPVDKHVRDMTDDEVRETIAIEIHAAVPVYNPPDKQGNNEGYTLAPMEDPGKNFAEAIAFARVIGYDPRLSTVNSPRRLVREALQFRRMKQCGTNRAPLLRIREIWNYLQTVDRKIHMFEEVQLWAWKKLLEEYKSNYKAHNLSEAQLHKLMNAVPDALQPLSVAVRS